MNLAHTVAVDPGIARIKDETPAIEAPPDTETPPQKLAGRTMSAAVMYAAP